MSGFICPHCTVPALSRSISCLTSALLGMYESLLIRRRCSPRGRVARAIPWRHSDRSKADGVLRYGPEFHREIPGIRCLRGLSNGRRGCRGAMRQGQCTRRRRIVLSMINVFCICFCVEFASNKSSLTEEKRHRSIEIDKGKRRRRTLRQWKRRCPREERDHCRLGHRREDKVRIRDSQRRMLRIVRRTEA